MPSAAALIADKIVEPSSTGRSSSTARVWQLARQPRHRAVPERWRRAPSSCCRTPIWRCTGPRPRAAASQLLRPRSSATSTIGRTSSTSSPRPSTAASCRLEYQPQLDLAPERVSGVEALLRWHHPELGAIEPETLIQLAESSGQIATIGEWALRRGLRGRRRLALRPSSRSGSRSTSRRASWRAATSWPLVARILDASGLPAERLELELTESSMLHELERVQRRSQALHEMGVAPGARRLRHRLRQPQPSQTASRSIVLKIDRSFVADLARYAGRGDRALADRARPPPGAARGRRGRRDRRCSWRRSGGWVATRSRATSSAIR